MGYKVVRHTKGGHLYTRGGSKNIAARSLEVEDDVDVPLPFGRQYCDNILFEFVRRRCTKGRLTLLYDLDFLHGGHSNFQRHRRRMFKLVLKDPEPAVPNRATQLLPNLIL